MVPGFFAFLTAGMALLQGVRAYQARDDGLWAASAFWASLHAYIWVRNPIVLTVVLVLLTLRLVSLRVSKETFSTIIAMIMVLPMGLILLLYSLFSRKKHVAPPTLAELPEAELLEELRSCSQADRPALLKAIKQRGMTAALPDLETLGAQGDGDFELYDLVYRLGDVEALYRMSPVLSRGDDEAKAAYLEMLLPHGIKGLEETVQKVSLETNHPQAAKIALHLRLLYQPSISVETVWKESPVQHRVHLLGPPRVLRELALAERRVQFEMLSETRRFQTQDWELKLGAGHYEGMFSLLNRKQVNDDRDALEIRFRFREASGHDVALYLESPCDILWPGERLKASRECPGFSAHLETEGCDDARERCTLIFEDGEEVEVFRKYLPVKFAVQFGDNGMQVRLDTLLDGEEARIYFQTPYERLFEAIPEPDGYALDICSSPDLAPKALNSCLGAQLTKSTNRCADIYPESLSRKTEKYWDQLLALGCQDPDENVQEASQLQLFSRIYREASWLDSSFPKHTESKAVRAEGQAGDLTLNGPLENPDCSISAGNHAVKASAIFVHQYENVEAGTDLIKLVIEFDQRIHIEMHLTISQLVDAALRKTPADHLEFWHEISDSRREQIDADWVVTGCAGMVYADGLRLRMPPLDISLNNKYQTASASFQLRQGTFLVLLRDLHHRECGEVPGVLANISADALLEAAAATEWQGPQADYSDSFPIVVTDESASR